jgi:hypothetical protein
MSKENREPGKEVRDNMRDNTRALDKNEMRDALAREGHDIAHMTGLTSCRLFLAQHDQQVAKAERQLIIKSLKDLQKFQAEEPDYHDNQTENAYELGRQEARAEAHVVAGFLWADAVGECISLVEDMPEVEY